MGRTNQVSAKQHHHVHHDAQSAKSKTSKGSSKTVATKSTNNPTAFLEKVGFDQGKLQRTSLNARFTRASATPAVRGARTTPARATVRAASARSFPKPPVSTRFKANPGTFDSRRGTDIDAIMLHHTAGSSASGAASALNSRRLSIHYIVDKDGTIYQMLADGKRARHAGAGSIRGDGKDLNDRTIGIEIVNLGNGTDKYTEAQYRALEKLVPHLTKKYKIPTKNIVRHSGVGNPDRPASRPEPSRNFDFARIRRAANRTTGGTTTPPRPTPPRPNPTPKPPAGGSAFNINNIEGVKNNPHVTAAFKREVNAMAKRLGTKPQYLMALMSFESGINPKAVNRVSNATGLIQFLPSTARGLGTSTAALKNMSSVEQLKFVEKYLKPFKGKIGTLEGAYTAVLSGSPKPNPNDVLFRRGTQAFSQNSGLDFNKDGKITSGEATSAVAAKLFGGTRKVQQKLKNLGFDPRGVDGAFGPNTSKAIAAFQKSRNIPVTGLLNDRTGRALFNISSAPTSPTSPTRPTAPSSPSASIPPAGLKRGDRGEGVKDLQRALVKLGRLTKADVDTGTGIYGAKTEKAVKEFQRRNGLEASGKLDVATRDAMKDLLSGGVGRGRNVNKKVTLAAQRRLVQLGFMTKAQVNTAPGTFGSQTEAALKRFQKAKGLNPSGALGGQTYRTLYAPRNSGVNGGNNSNAVPSGRPSVGAVTSRFGPRVAPVPGASTFHRGIDLGAPKGARAQATAPGKVIQAGNAGSAGNIVVIDHGNGFVTKYFHLSKIDVKVGQRVSDNQKIGEVGGTGNVSGPHMHYEVHRNGQAVDPAKFF